MVTINVAKDIHKFGLPKSVEIFEIDYKKGLELFIDKPTSYELRMEYEKGSVKKKFSTLAKAEKYLLNYTKGIIKYVNNLVDNLEKRVGNLEKITGIRDSG